MINRKVLYGYQIRNGALEIVPEEQRTVSTVFTLYNAGASYQAISDALNRQGIPYCREVPLWNKHKVKRLLENPRYTGKEGYPILVEADIFQAARKTAATAPCMPMDAAAFCCRLEIGKRRFSIWTPSGIALPIRSRRLRGTARFGWGRCGRAGR